MGRPFTHEDQEYEYRPPQMLVYDDSASKVQKPLRSSQLSRFLQNILERISDHANVIR